MKAKSLFLLFILSLLLYSCSNESDVDKKCITRAMDLIEENPSQALAILDSIENINDRSKENQMLYIVALVEAKNRLDLDLSKDTLIFQAQEYYNKTNNIKIATRANISAGIVRYRVGQKTLAMKSFLTSIELAEKKQDYFSLGRSYNNIGYVYYREDLMDSAIVNYQKALSYYHQADGTENAQLLTLKFLGISYGVVEDFENAHKYLLQGLEIAKASNDIKEQSKISHFLGFVVRDMGKYDEAAQYYNKALIGASSKDSIKIELSYSKLYNIENKPEQAKKHIDIITNKIANIKDYYTLQIIYTSLADYYKQTGDYQKAIHYIDQRRMASLRIKEQSQALSIVKAKQEDVIEKQDIKINKLHEKIIVCVIIIVLITILFIRIIWFMVKSDKKRQEEEVVTLKVLDMHSKGMHKLSSTYEELLNQIVFMNEEFHQLKDSSGQRELASVIRENFNNNLYDWAKGYISELSFHKEITDNFSDKEILILVLSCYKYSEIEISRITQSPLSKTRYSLENIKRKVNTILTDCQIELLFSIGDISTTKN